MSYHTQCTYTIVMPINITIVVTVIIIHMNSVHTIRTIEYVVYISVVETAALQRGACCPPLRTQALVRG